MQRTLIVVVLAVALCLGAGAVSAGDKVAIFGFEPDESAVDPGETVELDVVLDSDGSHEAGLYKVETRLDYPPSHVEVVDVEAGEWFQQDGAIDMAVTTQVDNDAGVAKIDQRIRDPDNGVTGQASVATVTLRVHEDVNSSTVHVVADESDALVVASAYPLPVIAQEAELDVAGGGESVEPDVDEEFEFEATPSSTDAPATEAASTDSADADNSTAAESSGDGSIPTWVAVVAFGAALVVRRRGISGERDR